MTIIQMILGNIMSEKKKMTKTVKLKSNLKTIEAKQSQFEDNNDHNDDDMVSI